MSLEIKNTEYNLIRQKLKRLEEAYGQSCDDNIRKSTKETAFMDLCMQIPAFYESFSEDFDKCQMISLRQIVDLSDAVLSQLDVQKLSRLELSQAKKILKLKEKALNQFLRGYNETAERRPLTYYSQQIDEKMVFLYYQDGQFIGVVGNVSKSQKMRESLCAFCNNFRKGDEIVFVSNTVSSANGDYSTLGQYCCKDTEKCNSSILDPTGLVNFMTYRGNQNIKKR